MPISKEKDLEAARASLQTLEERLQSLQEELANERSLQEELANERETLQAAATVAEEAKRVPTLTTSGFCMPPLLLLALQNIQCVEWAFAIAVMVLDVCKIVFDWCSSR